MLKFVFVGMILYGSLYNPESFEFNVQQVINCPFEA